MGFRLILLCKAPMSKPRPASAHPPIASLLSDCSVSPRCVPACDVSVASSVFCWACSSNPCVRSLRQVDFGGNFVSSDNVWNIQSFVDLVALFKQANVRASST